MTACHEIISEEWNSRSRELAEWAVDHSGASPPERRAAAPKRHSSPSGRPRVCLDLDGVLADRT